MTPVAGGLAVTTEPPHGAGIVARLGAGAAPGLIGHRADLDGIRGLAIAMVMTEHVLQAQLGMLEGFALGMAGVTVFFTLSGFLITSLLAAEDRIDVRNFYARRALRLGPALLALLAFAAVVGVVQGTNWIPGVASSLFYFGNWAHAAGWDVGLIGHTWSLAIEEQFYLIWPLVMLVMPRRWLLPVAATAAVIGLATYSGATYYSTLNNGAAIIAGSALALSGIRLPRLAGILGLALIPAAVMLWAHWLVVVGALLVIAGPVTALLPIAFLGRRAYSLYLWHVPFITLLGPLGIVPAAIAAEVSYRGLETPLLRRYRARLAPRPSSERLAEMHGEPVAPAMKPAPPATH